jgi:chromate transporter
MTTPAGEAAERPLGYGGLFLVFLKAGLAFGGGLGILAVLEDELVARRRLVSREEFLTVYGIGRIAPSGTMTAVAVAFGHRFGGQPGILIALAALTLPAFLSTVALTMAYAEITDGPLLGLLSVSVLPAALALIAAAALRLGRDMLRPSFELTLAAAGLAGALLLGLNPALLLVAGGTLGALVLAGGGETPP